MDKDVLKFPNVIFVSHYDHSTEESPSLAVSLTEKEAIEVSDSRPVMVARYQVVNVRKLNFKIEEE